MEDLEDRRVYEIRSRNLSVGIWCADKRGFMGVRRKFTEEYLFVEYHFDHDPYVGTVYAAKPLDIVVPEDIPLTENLAGPNGERGTWCSEHDRLVEWRPDEPGGRKGNWYHIDDDTLLAKDDWPQGKTNTALFDLLKPLSDAAWKKD